MTRRIIVLVAIVITTIPLLQSCDFSRSGSVVTLSVLPDNVCEGDTVEIQWTAGGSVTFIDDPSGSVRFEMTTDLPSEGSMSASVSDDADITATSSGPGESDSESVHINVFRTGDDHSIIAMGDCVGASPVWKTTFPPTEWSDRVRVGTVRNQGSDLETVTHGGRTVSIPPFATTSEFGGTRFEGDWDFFVSLLENPCLAERGGEEPPAAGIDAELVCE